MIWNVKKIVTDDEICADGDIRDEKLWRDDEKLWRDDENCDAMMNLISPVTTKI